MPAYARLHSPTVSLVSRRDAPVVACGRRSIQSAFHLAALLSGVMCGLAEGVFAGIPEGARGMSYARRSDVRPKACIDRASFREVNPFLRLVGGSLASNQGFAGTLRRHCLFSVSCRVQGGRRAYNARPFCPAVCPSTSVERRPSGDARKGWFRTGDAEGNDIDFSTWAIDLALASEGHSLRTRALASTYFAWCSHLGLCSGLRLAWLALV